MEINLSQKLSQKLTITPQLKQALAILCLNNLDLANKLQEELANNPFLELVEDKKVDYEETPEFRRETDIVWDYNRGDDDDSEPGYLGAIAPDNSEQVLFNLVDQINFFELNSDDQKAFQIIIKNLTDCGFFNCSLKELSSQHGIAVKTLEKNLKLIRSLDPTGIAAENLTECLLTQLSRFYPTKKLAYEIVKHSLTEVANKNFSKLAKIYETDEHTVISAIKIIQSLNPRPVVNVSTDLSRVLIPDLKLINNRNKWIVQLNEDSLPYLSISSFYVDLINQGNYNSQQEKKYLTRRYKDAGWLIQAIYQRKNTIKQVAEVIIHKQLDFFTKSKNLVPLKLSDIAQEIDVHESTVSRAVQDKFIATPKGIYPLKFFLRNTVKTSNGNFSDQEIKNMLLKVIKEESANKPLSDQAIANYLKESGYTIARRTVSKYRETLGIPAAKVRKNQAAIESI